MTLMLSSQGIGFITAVAVSGCSVMLLALGCQKLLELKKISAQQHSCEEENQESSPEPGGSNSWRSLPTFSIADYYRKDEFSLVLSQQRLGHDQCEEGSAVSWRIQLNKRRPNPMEAFRLKNEEDSRNGMNFCYEMPSASCRASDSNSQTPSAKKRNLGKKVRFSADVVEPSGNNVEYRRRHTLAIRSRCLRSQESTGVSRTPNSPSARIDPMTCSSSFPTRSERHDSLASVDVSRKPGWKAQPFAKPNIPPNRMALYNGIARYRSQREAFY